MSMAKYLICCNTPLKKKKRFLLGEGGKRVSVIIPHPQINPSHGLLSQRISNCRGEILI